MVLILGGEWLSPFADIEVHVTHTRRAIVIYTSSVGTESIRLIIIIIITFLSWMLSVQMEDRSDDDHRNFSSVTMITRWRRAKRVGKCSLVLWQFVGVYGIINLVGIFARSNGTFYSRLRIIWALLGSDNRTNWNHEVSRDCPAPRWFVYRNW